MTPTAFLAPVPHVGLEGCSEGYMMGTLNEDFHGHQLAHRQAVAAVPVVDVVVAVVERCCPRPILANMDH
jgi:hypothetical protein